MTDETRTYRGRSRAAGYRGIAVGFPEGLSYAFNAHTGTLSALWKGGYVTVRWDGQGAGGFNPAARAVELAQDTSFVVLRGDDDPWPLRPHIDEENPVDPDPLYPRNVGYRFRGYAFDEEMVPTFEYQAGRVAIRDRSHPVGGRLRRELSFDVPEPQTLHFRALTGQIEELGEGRYLAPRVELRATASRAILRPLAGSENERELILELALPAGHSTLTIDYELDD